LTATLTTSLMVFANSLKSRTILTVTYDFEDQFTYLLRKFATIFVVMFSYPSTKIVTISLNFYITGTKTRRASRESTMLH
jgi:hypothetical protein